MCTSGYGQEFLLYSWGTSACNCFPHFFRGGLQNKMLVGYKKKLKCPFHGGFLSFFETPPTFVFWFSTIYYGIFLIHTFFG
jgi:hypothetical protein